MEVRETVLLVEDDVALSKMVSGLIAEAGYQPIAIADHAQIASAVERWRPRCVILDGEVPKTGQGRSWDDAVAIRRAHPTLPVLMFTADTAALAEANAGISDRSRAAAFTGSVSKPFVVEEFLATLKSTMPRAGSATPRPAFVDPVAGEAFVVFPDLTRLGVDAARTDFVSAAVHELRAPLTVIRGQMQLARRRIGADPIRERSALDAAITQVDRMARLIDELLEHARLASGTLTLEVALFDLAALAAEAVERHQHAEPPRIGFASPDGPSLRVRGDVDCVSQILDNLLDNALKYSASDSTVSVAVTVADGEVQVRVTDLGVGVPDDELASLFSPYYRTSRTRAVPGTGLGLHISRQFARRCGGRLWLESSSSAGSVFAFALPLAT